MARRTGGAEKEVVLTAPFHHSRHQGHRLVKIPEYQHQWEKAWLLMSIGAYSLFCVQGLGVCFHYYEYREGMLLSVEVFLSILVQRGFLIKYSLVSLGVHMVQS